MKAATRAKLVIEHKIEAARSLKPSPESERIINRLIDALRRLNRELKEVEEKIDKIGGAR
jgi:hypothetical protein